MSYVEAEHWRCPGCVSNALEPETAMANAAASLSVRRSSAPKLARDLLPAQRGSIKPDSHSVFNHLIVDDDPMDGSRLLRKRKTSSAEAEDHPASLRKRRKNGSDGSSRVIASNTGAQEGIINRIRENNNEVEFTVGGDKDESITPRASRSLRPKSSGQPHALIIKKASSSLVLCIRISAPELSHMLLRIPKPLAVTKKRRSRTAASARISTAPSTYITQSYSQPFYSFQDKENDELKSKPYGGILTETETDTSKTLPQPEDRRRFDDARQKAEEEWKAKTAAALAELETVKKSRKVSGPASQIECINFGGYEIDTWYAAPYPEEYSRNRVLYICEFCLKYMNSEYVAWRHKLKCQAKHPPGDEIYRDGSVAVFEVDGRKNPVYCQNLCLLAKLFLGSKTLYYDVEPFLFYVMTEYDELGCHFVGYFSKEKRPASQNNVSCILTLPIHQRKGYGNLLIDFSYLLTQVEKKSGSPEKPLSDMGLVSYRNYWRLVLCYQLRNQKTPVSIYEISERTGMTADDIVSALEGLRALVRDPITGTYALRLDFDFYQEYIQKWENKNYVKLNPKALVWTPYIMGRNNTSIIEHGPPLNTIAPREGDDNESKPEDASQTSLVNGSSGITVNGITNGDEQEQGPQLEAMDVNIPPSSMLPSMVILGKGKGKGMGKGESLAIDSTVDTLNAPPSSARLLSQTMSAPSKTNGFTTSTPVAPSLSTIPPTRFEVFPPVPGSRSINRPRLGTSISRSAQRPRSALSNSVSRSRVNGRRRSGGARRSSGSSRQRSGTSKRPGGTGRGPGRWPKGTKKSDFGNADSGPGLPPRLLKQKSRLATEVTLGEEYDGSETKLNGSISAEADDGDAIMYETPGPRRRKNGDREVGKGKGKGKGIAIGLGKGKGNGNGAPKQNMGEEEDAEDPELITGDVDAEGEDE
jgi:histone acetyltransferase SAS3